MKHTLRIKRQYYKELADGTKHVEVRVGYASIKRIKAGDYITFENYGSNLFYVKRVTRYNSFAEMLSNEDVDSVLPGLTKSEALLEYQKIYPPAKERLGVYAIELGNERLDCGTITLSNAIDELSQKHYAKLAHIIEQGYVITDVLSKDYPDHCSHYYGKVVSGIFDGSRNIIVAKLHNTPSGVITLKRTAQEEKICSFYVAKRYRHQNVGKALLEAGFKWLNTATPVITMSEDKVKSFAKIIEHYNWQHTSTLPVGYYNNHSREFVFNENS